MDKDEIINWIVTLCFFSCLLPFISCQEKHTEGIPSKIVEMLDREYPKWKIAEVSEDVREYFKTKGITRHPNVVSGDFNDDGLLDYALLIKPDALKDRRMVIAFLNRDGSFDSYVLQSKLRPDFSAPEVYLWLFRKGERDYDYDADRYFHYPRDSIGVIYFEVTGVSYIFTDGKFHKVVTSD